MSAWSIYQHSEANVSGMSRLLQMLLFSFRLLSTPIDNAFPGQAADLPHARVSGPNTPTSVDVGPRFPPTPSEGCRFQIPSPHTPTATATGKSELQFNH